MSEESRLDDPALAAPYAAIVESLAWERVLLTIVVELACTSEDPQIRGRTPEVSFELVDGKRTFPIDATAIDDGRFELRLNVTTFAGRTGIPNGTWRIRPLVDGVLADAAAFDGRALLDLDDASRVFLYDANRSVLVVSFGITESTDHLDFLMRSYHMSRPKPKAKPGLRRAVGRVRSKLVGPQSKQRYAGWFFSAVSRLVGPRPGRILFASDQRSQLEGNLLRVQERLIERGLDGQLDLRYSFRLPRGGGWGTTFRILYLMATSEVILLDDYFGLLKSVRIGERTKVIQLWHAGSGFKSVGYSRFGNPGSPKLWHPHRQYTYAITGSKHLVPVYAEAFGIEEQAVIPTGLPRVDWFLDEERTTRFRRGFFEEFPQLEGKRIILFAPTFRGRSIYTAFYDYDQIDFDALADAVGPDTVVLFRMHHFVKQPIQIPKKHRDRFFDFTHYRDGLGLLHVTDLLITDYSSIIYEYSLLDRPMLFFAPDKVNYAATRGFHRDYDETAPGRVCTTFAEVVDAIVTGEFEQEKVATFRAENFDRIDTGAADRVIDMLILSDPTARGKSASRSGDLDEDTATEEDEEAMQ